MVVFTLGNLASVFAPTYGTLMAARFVAGLPHGAFFGIAALVAAHLMGPQNRAKAVGPRADRPHGRHRGRCAGSVVARPGPRVAQPLSGSSSPSASSP